MQSQDDARSGESGEQRIRVGEDGDGGDVWLPVVQVLTGRGFVTGTS